MLLIHRGDTGPAVSEVRNALIGLGLLLDSGSAGGVYDNQTDLAVRAFQQNRGLTVDGVVGSETYRAINSARWRLGDRVITFTAGRPLAGDDVSVLQERLLELGYDAGRADGVFGERSSAALRAFQRDYGLGRDGTCGPETLRALRQLGRKVVGGRPQLLRETTKVANSGPALVGKRVIIDPGHGGDDPGATHGSLAEADLAWDLATRLEGRLGASGVTAYLTRGRATGLSDSDRARFANSTGADVVISLHVDATTSPLAQGVATYHFGTGSGLTSTVGEQLAGLVHREVVARTGMVDCRTHAKTWELLRLTTMPAIRLEVGHLSHAGDRARLADAAFRDTVAEAVLVAVQRLYLPAEIDPPTGTFMMPV
ncbi:MAG TPA: N-acetylmuramoyl-L-alanine amidase [Mycobacteriales bacterium]|nr:N-acetylmuramoyl-L-alanine amidase [Mycobacteriales bacterium]